MNGIIKSLLKATIPTLAILAFPAFCPAEDLPPGKNYQQVQELTRQILSSNKIDAKSKAKVKAASVELDRQFHLLKAAADVDEFDSSYQVQNYLSLCKGILKGHFNKSHTYRRLGDIARGGTGKP